MALFSPQLSQGGSGFAPVPTPQDNTIPNAINQIGNLATGVAEQRADARKLQSEQASDQAFGGLFADTLQTEAQVLRGQEALEANQRQIDNLFQDGTISEEEQAELTQLQEQRAALDDITNPRQRQVQMRMKYANFVNRFPHLTKEARVMFGGADTRMQEIAQGAQGLVDEEAFEQIFGKNYTAENVSRFRNLQRYRAKREVGLQYGEDNFDDWSDAFGAEVTSNLYLVGQRMNSLVEQQGAIRQEDIDTFSSSINQGYMDGVQAIDQKVLQMQRNGQYVSNETVNAMKADLRKTRDTMLEMSEGKDFKTRLRNLNEAMDEHMKYEKRIQLGAMGELFAGEGGGGTKGAADLATMKALLSGNAAVDAAKGMGGPYGDQVRMLQEGVVQYMNFLDNYDPEEAARTIAPTMARNLAEMQSQRIGHGGSKDRPEMFVPLIDLMEKGGTSDETAEAMVSWRKEGNEASIKNNEVKARVQSFVNNYTLETQEALSSVGARVRETENGFEAFVTGNDGKFRPYREGTQKIMNTLNLFEGYDQMGGRAKFKEFLDGYKNTLNAEVQEVVDTLSIQDMPEAVKEKTINRLRSMYSLTEEEIQQIREQLRGTDGQQASGSRDQ